MEIYALFLIAPILTWGLLSVLPVGRLFLVGLGVFVLFWLDGGGLVTPLRPSGGFDAVGQTTAIWGSLLAAVLVSGAQFWRLRRKTAGLETHYPLTALAAGAVTLLFCFAILGSA